MRNILIGADPELMVARPDGLIVPVCGMLGGDKTNPIIVPRGAVQEDNVNAEFNINPAENEQAFVTNLQEVMNTLESMLPPGVVLEVKSSHHYTKQALKQAGSQAMQFGCSPDYNCHSRTENTVPHAMQTLRTAGGHVHIGWGSPVEEDKWNVGVVCDYLLGLWSLSIDHDDERRNLYGKAGAVRVKDYGVEYRVLSNFWLKSEELMREVYRRATLAAQSVDKLPLIRSVINSDDVQRIINTNARGEAAYALRAVEEAL